MLIPEGKIPRSVTFDDVASMELTELAQAGWRVVAGTRLGIGFTPWAVILEREIDG